MKKCNMKPNQVKIRMLADFRLCLMFCACFFGLTLLVVYTIIDGWNTPWGWEDYTIHIPHLTLYIFGGLWLPFGCVCIYYFPRVFVFLTLSAKGVHCQVLFHKAIMASWKEYKNIYPATYYHGSVIGIGYYPDYLVLSKRQVSIDELKNVNQASIDEEFLKIRITRRRYRKLEAILPPYPKLILEKYYAEKYGEK